MTTETAPPVLHDRGHDRDRDFAAIRALLAGVQDGMNARDADRCVRQFAADTSSITSDESRPAGGLRRQFTRVAAL